MPDRSNYAVLKGSGYAKLPSRLSGVDANANLKLKTYTTTQRNALSLGTADKGTVVMDTTLNYAILWNGSAWVKMDGTAAT